LTPLEGCCWELRPVGRVGEMLILQTQTVAAAGTPRRPFRAQRAIEKIAAIELHTRLGGVHLHDSARGRFIHARGAAQRCGRAIQHPGVVAALAVCELLVVGIDPCTNGDGGRVKSIGEARTARSSPVGMSAASTGTKRSASMVSSWLRMSPVPAPVRLKQP